MFLSIIVISVLVQIIFIEAFGSFTKTAGLPLSHWLISIAIGGLSVPLGILMRFIPVVEDENTFRGYSFENTAAGDDAAAGETMAKTAANGNNNSIATTAEGTTA